MPPLPVELTIRLKRDRNPSAMARAATLAVLALHEAHLNTREGFHGATVDEVARLVGRSPTTTATHLLEAERRGLVRRVTDRDPDERRLYRYWPKAQPWPAVGLIDYDAMERMGR